MHYTVTVHMILNPAPRVTYEGPSEAAAIAEFARQWERVSRYPVKYTIRLLRDGAEVCVGDFTHPL